MGCSCLFHYLLCFFQQSRVVSVLCTMLLVVTYCLYCLTGLCDSAPRTLIYINNNHHHQHQQLDDIITTRDYGDGSVPVVEEEDDGRNDNNVNNRRVLFDELVPRLLQAARREWNHTDAIVTHTAGDTGGGGALSSTQVDEAATGGGAGGHHTVDPQQQQGGGGPPPSSSMPVANTFGTKKFPQAIIIGVKKGGTRALLEFLRIHPDVRAVGAEPHFFDRFYDKGLEWYRSLMPRTLEGQITMEKTPSYFVTKETPQRVGALHPRPAKLIVVVRDPVTRALSDYAQTLSKNPGLPSFQSLALKNSSSSETAMTTDDDDGGPTVDASWSAVRIGLYAKHLENWLRHFPLSRFLFVSGERLVTDPAGEMGRVQDFLGLKRVVSDKHFYFNRTKGFPCLKKPEGSSRPRCLGKSKGRPHPRIPRHVLQRLRDFYRPHNLRFYQMTGHDFGWD